MAKKILFILPSLTTGGLEKVQVNIANALVQKGYDVTIKIIDQDRTLEKELLPQVHLKHKPHGPLLMKKIPYVRYKFYDTGLWETRASAKRLYKYYVGKEKYDVEIAFFRGLPVKIISGSTNKNAVKLCWVHSDFEKITGYMSNFKKFIDVKRAYSKFDKVVCVSKNAKQGFDKVIGTGNSTTVYNLSLVEQIIKLSRQFAVENGGHKINAVTVGRLFDTAKGQIRLISAIKHLVEKGIDIGLTIVGDGVDRKRIEEFITKNGCQDYVKLVGNQPNPYPFIKSADLLICSSYFEGYNLTVAEALILGVPVLSTDCVGPREILDNGKYGLIVENSEKGLINGLMQLSNVDTLNKYRQKALERIDFFNQEKILEQITDLFIK